MANEQQKKGNTAVPLIIIAVVLVAIVGVGYWLYSQSKPAANTNSNGTPKPAQTRTTPPPNAPPGATPPNQLGSPTASVKVEEFADFQCPTCAAVHPMMKEINSTYGSKIQFIFRNYPLPMHDKSYDAAVAAEAAGLQGKFWQMQDQIFTNQQTWSTESPGNVQIWVAYAQKIGLDPAKFQSDMNSMPAKERVNADLARAKALGVGSTPSIFVNDQLVPVGEMNVAGLRRIIDSELQRTAAAQTQSSAPASAPANSNAK